MVKAVLGTINLEAQGICWTRFPPIFQLALSKRSSNPLSSTPSESSVYLQLNTSGYHVLCGLAFSYEDELKNRIESIKETHTYIPVKDTNTENPSTLIMLRVITSAIDAKTQIPAPMERVKGRLVGECE